jgi:hypothetical protein
MAEDKVDYLWHPLVPIVFGAGIVWDAPGNIIVRSVFLMGLWIWLCIDIGRYTKRRVWPRQKKILFFCLSCCLAGVLTMGVMDWLLKGKLEEQQEDTYRNLNSQIQLPGPGDVMNGFFTLGNGGKTSINHFDFCGIHLIVGNNGYTFVARLSVGGFPYGRTLGPSGVAQSVQCLQLFAPVLHTVDCADVEFWTEYSLENQPLIIKKKYFRSYGYRSGNQFVFVPEPPSGEVESLADDLQYCGKYLKVPFPQLSPKH